MEQNQSYQRGTESRFYVSPIVEFYSINLENTLLQASGGTGGTVPDPIDGGDD